MTFEGLIRLPDSLSSTTDAQECAILIFELFRFDLATRDCSWPVDKGCKCRERDQVRRKAHPYGKPVSWMITSISPNMGDRKCKH
jgi:hypothetical protein